MNRLARFAVVASLALPTAVVAQTTEDSVLAGVRAVDAKVELTWDSRIKDILESQVQVQMEQRYTLELRKLGIQVSSLAPNELVCTVLVKVVPETPGMIALSKIATYGEFVTVKRLPGSTRWGTLWRGSYSVSTVGMDNFREALETSATRCAEAFGNAWLSVNPRP